MSDSRPSPEGQQEHPQPNSGTVASDRGVPNNLVIAGISVGLLLILLGLVFLWFGRTSLLSSLLTCVGFGLVLAAFGSKASGSWAGWTITGSGAMAIVLFLVLQHYASSTYYKKGKLHGDLSQVADLAIIDANPLYTYRDKNTRSIEFIILSKKLQSKQMMIQIYTTEKEAGKEFFEMIGDTKNIYDNYLSNDNDTDNFIQWQLDYAARTVKDGSKVIFQEPESIRENVPHELHSGLGLSLQGINFIRDARAGEMIGQSAMKAEILWIS